MNLDAARNLNQVSLYNPGVHCSYYACVQMFLHIIFNQLNISRQKFELDRRINKDGSHGWASKLIARELGRKNHGNFKWFQRIYPELKKLREEADYSETMMRNDEAMAALQKSEGLIRMLKTEFK